MSRYSRLSEGGGSKCYLEFWKTKPQAIHINITSYNNFNVVMPSFLHLMVVGLDVGCRIYT